MDGRITPIDVNAYVINCYRLAKFYQCDPKIFLAKTFTEISRDLYWTDEMQKGDQVEEAWQDKLRSG